MAKKENKAQHIINATLKVKRKEYITPHYLRITLTGADVPRFAAATVGENNKIFIPPAGVTEIHFPTFENGKWSPLPPEVSPAVRTYTHRGIDLEKNEMYIDFVAHGDNGPASAWAIHAKEGDPLGIAMYGLKTELYPEADWYLLAGDATAIPVISAILEDLPENTHGVAHILVESPQEIQPIQTRSKVVVNWHFYGENLQNTILEDRIREIPLPEATTRRFGYVAAEFSAVKAIRNYLRKELNWTKEELYAYSYWKFGTSEEQSATERREEHQSV